MQKSASFFNFIFHIFLIVLFLPVEVSNKGNLIGFVYGEDENTQVEGTVFKIKNIATSKVLKNSKYSKLGVLN